MKFSLLSLFLLQTTQGAQILRHRRDAEPLFGGIINNILGIFTGGQNNPPAPPPSYHRPAPSYKKPAPSYHAPAPTYHAPAPSYHAPAPAHHAPTPVHHAPAPVYHATAHHVHAPAPAVYDPPAPKPEIHILPAPDLSQYAPTVDSYGSPVATTYVEPAPAVDSYGSPVAPAYVEPAPVSIVVEPVPVYEQAAPAPAYEEPTPVPAPTYIDTAPIITYEEPVPIVDPVPVEPVPVEAAPVYEPTNYEPAPVDIAPLARLQPVLVKEIIDVVTIKEAEEPAPVDISPVPETVVTEIIDVVTLKEAEEPQEIELVDLRSEAERNPKALSSDPAQVNTIQPITIKSEDNKFIIDLTRENDNFIIVTEASLLETEGNNEAQPADIIFEQSPIQSIDQLPVLIPVELPASPPQFEPSIPTTQPIVLDSTSPAVTVETTVLDDVDIVQTQEPVQIISFHTIALDNVLDTFHTVDDDTTEVPVDLPVTPIVASEELRSLVQPQEEIFFVTNEGNGEVEIFDLVSGDQQTEDLTIVELSDPEVTLTLSEEAKLVEEELVEEFGEEAVFNLEKELVNQVEEELVQEVEAEIIEELENEIVQEVEAEIIEELENEIVETLAKDAVSLLEEEAIQELEEVVEELESIVQDQSEASTPAPLPVTTKGPTFRKVTFRILGTDETTPEPSAFILVDPEDAALDTFTVNDDAVDTFTVNDDAVNTFTVNGDAAIPDAPASLNSDPAFVEIAAESSPLEQRKRGLRNYDPRQRVYGHKYNDQFSNWYYYSRNGY